VLRTRADLGWFRTVNVQSIRLSGHFGPFHPCRIGKLRVFSGISGSTPAASTNLREAKVVAP
jgi:hypothetical protein